MLRKTSSHDLRLPLLALTLLLSAACGSAGGGSDGEAQRESNSPPYLPTQKIQPSHPGTDDTLTVTGSASDADGDPIVQTLQWYVNGALVASSDSLPGSAFSKGDRIHVIVSVSDGKDETTRSSDTVTIANSPPTPPEVMISPPVPVATQDDLICEVAVPSTDLDADPITYAIAWEVNGAPWEGPIEATWNAGDTIQRTHTTPGERWSCRVTPDDGDEEGGSETAAVVFPFVIGEIAPRVAVSWDHYCAVDRFGHLACGGESTAVVLGAPDGTFFEVGVGRDYACAIRVDDRAIQCWGEAGSGALDPPGGAFHRLATGEWEACAIRNDGYARCWWTGGLALVYRVPPSNWKVQEIWNDSALGGCALFPPDRFSPQARMSCWGSPANDFASVLPDTRFKDLSLGNSYFCALDAAGEIECFLEHDGTDDPSGVLQAPAGGFAKIATTTARACGIRTGGELACWGEDFPSNSSPPAGAFTDLDLGISYGCAMGADGDLACWGLLPSD